MRRWSEPSWSRHFLLQHALPFEFGDFFDEALQFLVIVYRLPDAGLPRLGDAELSWSSIVALDQIQGVVQLAVGAVAGGFATFAATNGQSSAKQPVAESKSGDPGAYVLLGRREADTVHGHLLSEISKIPQMDLKDKLVERSLKCTASVEIVLEAPAINPRNKARKPTTDGARADPG
jgi:hypothetical protein